MSELDIDYKSTLKCPLPFNSLYYDMYGNMGPCNLNPLISARPVKDYLKSNSLLQIRNDMLNEVPTSGHCTNRCYSKSRFINNSNCRYFGGWWIWRYCY